ncbi:MAG: hypothetical protein WBX23_09385 [Candidatus Cybelea sp.]
MRFVAFLELHRFVTDAQRAHFKFAEILVSRRSDGGKLRWQKERTNDCAGHSA